MPGNLFLYVYIEREREKKVSSKANMKRVHYLCDYCYNIYKEKIIYGWYGSHKGNIYQIK